ncbi:hypothetical protein HDU82_001514 [Entophlyctis luteolus]|nr:hypothetical protein HDU82_001514 [Entophlyctis luteolus]
MTLSLTTSIIIDAVRPRIPPLLTSSAVSLSLHKGHSGRILVVGGSSEYSGAPYYAGIAALRTGADICHIVCHPAASGPLKAYSPDLIVHPIIDASGGKELAVAKAVALMSRVHVVVVGPGLSRDEFMADVAAAIILEAKRRSMPLVVDAVLTSAVLTPNHAEFKRLCDAVKPKTYEPSSLSESLGGAVVFQKGHFDVISNGQTTLSVEEIGSPRRCGGQGDLLSGAVATFIAWMQLFETGVFAESKQKQSGVVTVAVHDSEGKAGTTEIPLGMLACAAGSVLVKQAAHRAFKVKGRAMTASVMADLLGEVFADSFDNLEFAGNCLCVGLNLGFLIAFKPQASDLGSTSSADDSSQPRVCENGVQSYLIGQLVLYVFYSLPQRPLQYYIENFNPEARYSKVVGFIWALWSVFTVFDIIWFFTGQYWTFTSSLCKIYDPPLFWLAVLHIIFFYLTTVIPIILYAIFVGIQRRRRRHAELHGGTGPAAHLKGGLSKAELATLRTFIFRTNMAVVPEEDEELGNYERMRDGEQVELQVVQVPVNSDTPGGEGAISLRRDSKGKSAVITPEYLSPDAAQVGGGSSATQSTGTKSENLETSTSPLIHNSGLVEDDLPAGAPTNCTICFCDFEAGDVIRELACKHIFHADCIDPWIIVPDEPSSSSTPQKAHRTCPLCVREVILPEYRDKEVELAMAIQKKEDEEMAVLIAQLKKEAEEEQALIERRRKRAEARKQRRVNGSFAGLLLNRGRSKTTEPAKNNAGKDEAMKRSASVDAEIKAPEIEVSADATISNGNETNGEFLSPQERLTSMKNKLETIKSMLLESPSDGQSHTTEGALATVNAVGLMLEAVEVDLKEEERALRDEYKDGAEHNMTS